MNLKKSIENLYSVFAKYYIEGCLRDRSCECCVSDEEIKQLISKPLKEINENEIYHFMTSATTTFGNIKDFKHFLPRILELMQNPKNNIIGDFITFEKLNYNQWNLWEANETNNIKRYFEASLINALDEDLDSINDFILLNLMYNDFESLSNILINTNSKKFLLEIIDGELNGYFYKVNEQLIQLYSTEKMLNKIEQLFFETKDKELGKRISIAYSLLDSRRVTKQHIR